MSADKRQLKPIVLGISQEAILRMELDTLQVIQQYPFDELKRFSSREQLLTLEFDQSSAFPSYQCWTSEGLDITTLLHDALHSI